MSTKPQTFEEQKAIWDEMERRGDKREIKNLTSIVANLMQRLGIEQLSFTGEEIKHELAGKTFYYQDDLSGNVGVRFQKMTKLPDLQPRRIIPDDTIEFPSGHEEDQNKPNN